MRASNLRRAGGHLKKYGGMVLRSARCWPALAAVSVGPALAADAENGKRLAQRWCASCHVVAPDQTAGNADAPPFATIAKTAGFSAEKLAFFLLEPHPKMPTMALTRNEANDIAAYVGTLAK